MDYRIGFKVLPSMVLSAAGLLVGGSAMATDPAHLQAGPLNITPTLNTRAEYIDNLFRSENDEKSTWATKYTPAVRAWMQSGLNIYSLRYEAEISNYASSHDDDFTDQTVNLDIHQEFNARNTLNLKGEFYDGHEERGSGLSDGFGRQIDEPVEYERSMYGGDYTFGAASSKARLTLAAKVEEYEYKNLRDLTQFRDRERDTMGATLFVAIAPKTDVLVEVRQIENEYDAADPNFQGGSLDSEEYNYYVGASWDATAKTSGSVRVGWYDRDFESGLRKDADGFSWEADVTYSPRTYSQWNLQGRRYFQETTGLGDAINTNEASLSWNHKWSDHSRTELGLTFASEDYIGSDRDDDRLDFEAGYYYGWRRWLDLGIGYRLEDRDSTLDAQTYTRNVLFLDAEFSL